MAQDYKDTENAEISRDLSPGAEGENENQNEGNTTAALSHGLGIIPERKEKRENKSKKRNRDPESKKNRKKDTDDEAKRPGIQWREGDAEKSTGKVAVTSKERRPAGRHMFRSRHIEQKKKSLLDDRSLNEVSRAQSSSE